MRKGWRAVSAVLGVIALGAVVAPGLGAAGRDDTDWFQSRLDGGGKVFIPKLPGGECYRTRGLWVSRSWTRVASNGACILYLGPGPDRLRSPDGDPIAANAIFSISRSSELAGPPQHVAISDLTLIVPIGTDGYGVIAAGNHVALVNLHIDGVPTDAIMVTGRNIGLGYAGPVTIRNSLILGAKRNGISVVGATDVTIDGNTITGVGTIGMENPELGPWAGIDIEPDVARYPIERVTISRNTISGNAGSGVLLALVTSNGRPGVAKQINLTGNAITFNGVRTGAFLRGGVCLQGGQSDGGGTLRLTANEIAGNGGYGLCTDATGFNMQIALSCNLVHDNSDGDSQWGALGGEGAAKVEGAVRGSVGCG